MRHASPLDALYVFAAVLATVALSAPDGPNGPGRSQLPQIGAFARAATEQKRRESRPLRGVERGAGHGALRGVERGAGHGAQSTLGQHIGQGIASSLNVNEASADELLGLKGVGPVIAGRIVAYRQQHGRFRTLDELTRVSGIGPKKLELLRPQVTVQSQPAVGTDARAIK